MKSDDPLKVLSKALTHKAVDQIQIHENTRIFALTKIVSSKIPTSHAAGAYNDMANSLLKFEAVKLAALWGTREGEVSIPNLMIQFTNEDPSLFTSCELIKKYCIETMNGWTTLEDIHQDCSDYNYETRTGLIFARKTAGRIQRSVKIYLKVKNSDVLKNLNAFRHRDIAHNLRLSRTEQRAGIKFPNPTIRDISWIHSKSIGIIEDMYNAVCQTSFNLRTDVRKEYKKRSSELWNNFKFEIPTRD